MFDALGHGRVRSGLRPFPVTMAIFLLGNAGLAASGGAGWLIAAIAAANIALAGVAVGRRLAWAEVVAVGQNVRTVEPGDRVLFDPEDRAEVEVRGVAYVLMRERDLHAVAADRFEGSEDSTGLYL